MEIEGIQQQVMMKNFKNLPKIQVIIRKRPVSKKEESRGEKDVVDIYDQKELILQEQKQKVDLTKYTEEHSFLYDNSYDSHTTNQHIYETNVQALVEASLSGAKVTVFAYGQTGSGKTFTMMGDQQNYSQKGLYLLAVEDIFTYLKQDQRIVVSFYEIYCGKLFDLLNDRNQLQIREDGKKDVNIIGLSELRIDNPQQMMETIQKGMGIRITSITGMNLDSSRSHAILQINIKQVRQQAAGRRGQQMQEKVEQVGKLSFIDLAGNERASDVTDMHKQTRLDGAEINKSLLALKECIRALDMDKTHIPFRQNKLTLVLKDSFVGGECKSVMIGNISPSTSCCEHTLNTLRYADRVKELRKGVPNKDKDNLMLARKHTNHSQNNNNQYNQFNQNQFNNYNPQQFQLNNPNQVSQSIDRQQEQSSHYKRHSMVDQPSGKFSQQKQQQFSNYNKNINNSNNNINDNGFPQEKENILHVQMQQMPIQMYSDHSKQQSNLQLSNNFDNYHNNNTNPKQDLLILHRQNINDMVELTKLVNINENNNKQEMQMVADVEAQTDEQHTNTYTQQLESIIQGKIEILQGLLGKVQEYRQLSLGGHNGNDQPPKTFNKYEEQFAMFNGSQPQKQPDSLFNFLE